MKQRSEETYSFKATMQKCIYCSDTFKVYAMNVDKNEYPNIKHNQYDNVSISGDLPVLSTDLEYEIIAYEETGKYGPGYKVKSITREGPKSDEDIYSFLCNVLTQDQADTIYNAYPDIVQRVKDGRLEDVDLNKLKGIKEKTFAKICSKIIDNYVLFDLIAEFHGILTMSMIKRIYEIYPSVEKLKHYLKTKPYTTLMRVGGIGFKRADEIALRLEEEGLIEFEESLLTSADRCLASVTYILQQNEEEGNTRANLAEVHKKCVNLTAACAKHFTEVVQDDSIYYNKDRLAIALRKTYNTESKIANVVRGAIVGNCNMWDYDVMPYRSCGQFALTDEQMGAIKNVCLKSFSVLNGPAGSGKSSAIDGLIKLLDDNGKSYIILAPTGKAAKVISRYTGRNASTIHRGLGYNPMSGWRYNQSMRLPQDVVIVDECSMIDIWLFEHLLDAIDFTRTKLLMIGDDAQLPSIGAGNVFHDLLNSKIVPATTLTQIFRYKEDGLLNTATRIRYGQQYLDKEMKNCRTEFGDNGDYVFIDVPTSAVANEAVKIYKALLDNGVPQQDVCVLSAKNVGPCGVIELNKMLQRVANVNYGCGEHLEIGDGDNKTVYYVGDVLLQKRNTYDMNIVGATDGETAFVANGETGIIRRFDKDEQGQFVVVSFGGVDVKYYKTDMNPNDVGLAYAQTVHKAQGSGVDYVILCTPSHHSFMLNSNLLYVALTRTKKKCFHVGDINAVNTAVKKKEDTNRCTFLKSILNNSY